MIDSRWRLSCRQSLAVAAPERRMAAADLSDRSMLDFDIQRCTRRCAATDRDLLAGEFCYSVLVDEGAQLVRRDYSVEGWKGPPEGAQGWWRSTVVDPNAKRVHWAPSDVMLDYFQQLGDDPAAADVRYVLALLLVRRRILRNERTETDAVGNESLVLFSPRQEAEFKVTVVQPAADRVIAIQQQLASLLQTGST